MTAQATNLRAYGDRDRFTCGDCHILARALHLRTGWPIGVTTQNGEWDGHAFVVHPGGQGLDYDGLSDPFDLVDAYAADDWITADWPSLRKQWGGAIYGSYSYRRAKIVAADLVERYT